MKKIIAIGIKDLILIFRDKAALIMMLAAPLALTAAMGLVSGAFSDKADGPAGLQNIDVAIYNADDGQIGAALVDLFEGDDLEGLVQPQIMDSAETARQLVDDDTHSAAIIIPAHFSDALTADASDTAMIEVYRNPNRSISPSVIVTIVERFIAQVETGQATIQISLQGLLESGRLPFDQIESTVDELVAAANDNPTRSAVTLHTRTLGAETSEGPTFNPLNMLAPSMAIFFLMFTVTNSASSFIKEQNEGTMRRILTTPTTAVQLFAGKMFGVFLTAVAQVGLLIIASGVLFSLDWGDTTALVLLVLAVAAAATGWGLLLAGISRTQAQATSMGSALMLIFGVLGGNFFRFSGIDPFSGGGWMNTISKITPNKWALDGFSELALGRGLSNLLPTYLALLIMAAILFVISTLLFSRRAAQRM